MRILVIEDEVQLRTQVQQQLQAAGYTVDVSGDGKEGCIKRVSIPWMLRSWIWACQVCLESK